MKPNCPCKDCVAPKRTSDCHIHCKEYNTWNAENIDNNLKRYEKYESGFTNNPNKMTAIRKRMNYRKG